MGIDKKNSTIKIFVPAYVSNLISVSYKTALLLFVFPLIDLLIFQKLFSSFSAILYNMPLSAAEKQRRYRAKRRLDKAREDANKEKDLQR